MLSINLLVPLLGTNSSYIQDLQESTSVLRKDEDTPSDSQKIAMKSLMMEETSKVDISHQKAVETHRRKHIKEIDSLQFSKLKDSPKEIKLSSEECRMSETFSGDEPSRELVKTGKIKKK